MERDREVKNLDNVAPGHEKTILSSKATTIVRNAEVDLDYEEWDDELFKHRDLIGIEFDRRVDPRSETELDQLIARTEKTLWPAFFLRYELDRRVNNRHSDQIVVDLNSFIQTICSAMRCMATDDLMTEGFRSYI